MRSTRSKSAIVLIALVGSLLIASAPSVAGPPGQNGPIVYTAADGLHVVQANGSGADLVVAGSFTRPDVSSDGTAVLVVEAAEGENGPLVSVDLATGAKTTVVSDPVRAGVWSGDGSQVAYATDGGIWVKTGSAPAVQVSETHSDIYDWSPVDDRVIVTRSVPGDFPAYFLETLDVETKAVELIRDNGPALFTWYIMDADFSPDGEAFVYSSVTPGVVEIVITGQESDPIDPGGSAMGNPRGAVAWSPDGSSVVYTTYGTGFAEVLAVHKLASGATSTFASGAVELQWAPVPKEEPPPTDKGFEDVSEDNVFAADIAWLADKGITQGCNPPDNTQFCPDDNVTRGQMAAFLVRAFGYTDDGGGDLFSDDDESVFEGDIDRLATAGVTRGCNPPDNTEYCPDDFVTRGQMAAFLVRAFGYTDDGGGDLFSDDDGSVFEGDIDRLATAGVTRGCNPPDNTEYCPSEYVTRAQMAAFLHRALGD